MIHPKLTHPKNTRSSLARTLTVDQSAEPPWRAGTAGTACGADVRRPLLRRCVGQPMQYVLYMRSSTSTSHRTHLFWAMNVLYRLLRSSLNSRLLLRIALPFTGMDDH